MLDVETEYEGVIEYASSGEIDRHALIYTRDKVKDAVGDSGVTESHLPDTESLFQVSRISCLISLAKLTAHSVSLVQRLESWEKTSSLDSIHEFI